MNSAAVYDARFQHPFTCLVAGPSGAGKSTFVKNLLLKQGKLINIVYDYVLIMLGTSCEENPVLCGLKKSLKKNEVEIFELKKMFDSNLKDFQEFFETLVFEKYKGKNGCIIFDDLMSELSQTSLLVDLFTKYSSHGKITVIHLTQNIFFKSSGKHSSDNTTIYRNTHVLVLFKNPLDNSVVSLVAKRISVSASMIKKIQDEFRYVVIHGNFNTPNELKITSDIFCDDPIPYKRVFQPIASSSKK